MTAQDWINSALSGQRVCNIGQIDKPTARALDRLVKQGALVKSRGHWYPGLGSLKTIWHLPNAAMEG